MLTMWKIGECNFQGCTSSKGYRGIFKIVLDEQRVGDCNSERELMALCEATVTAVHLKADLQQKTGMRKSLKVNEKEMGYRMLLHPNAEKCKNSVVGQSSIDA